jgi:hypothetical protein
MGVDISGKNPIVRGKRPEINWETATDEIKDHYWKELGAWEKENPGDYFRANWWSWRPIVMLIEKVNEEKDLGIDTRFFGSNDGAGPDDDDQDTCGKLADGLQEILDANPNMNDEDDRIFLVMGSWVSLDGSFIHSSKIEEMEDQLPEYGTVMYSSFIAPDGSILQPAHSTSKRHLQEFINFLRECGGFEIW